MNRLQAGQPHMMMTSKKLEYFENASSFIAECKTISSSAELVATFHKHISELGFCHFTCTSFCSDSDTPHNAVRLAEYPSEWIEHYIQQSYKKHDRILSVARNRIIPFSWDDPVVMHGMTDLQEQIFQEARETGIIHGVTVPVYADGFIPATINIVGPNRDVDPDVQHALHLMSIYLYDTAVKLRKQEPETLTDRVIELTDRERECLQWVAEGKSESVIAELMNISQSTVHFHVENTKRKYGVATRVQAVVRAFLDNQLLL
ncbi:hypothetical protein GCM10017044_19320 [Kordiimonas sediminis]|uniref:HTH luxR-type domain-containing protein n=1 Tax=Kordiimonas sediminis TaxID=1735581 RepID=A0A919E8G8_9PROT|nr:LuxR family transcriptional regulator [Kordiimonas sediminis]GHF24761.1 hypothetical protein GCM10017044_19320 [Kordiimonas sediminis]